MSFEPKEAYWTQQRRELLRWFEDRAPSFVEGYVGALRLLYTPSFPGRIHFICHAIRDVYRHLPTLLGKKSLARPGEVFPGMVKDLAERWKKHPANPIPPSTPAGSDHTVSPQVYKCVQRIVRKSEEIADQLTVGNQLVIALFDSHDRRKDEFIPRWIIKSFDAEYDFFVKRAHLAKSVDSIPNDDGLAEHFEAFERAFHSLMGPYFSGKEELDAILQDTNESSG